MTKLEMAGYLCNLQTIMEGKEDAGLHRGKTLAWEYNRTYKELLEAIRKERPDGERKEA